MALAVALASVPPASAHGAPPVREVDTRLLLDNDGVVGYGGCVEGTCQPAAPVEGLDVLALDVREAYLPDGSPAAVFRIIVQSQEPQPGASLVLHLEAGGAAKDLEVTTADGLAYASSAFDRLEGPFDVGDGHPKAVDGWLRESTLGIAVGGEVTGITVESRMGGTPSDAMPGGWFLGGQPVPALSSEPDPGALSPQPGSYTLRGPAALLTGRAAPASADLATGNPAAVKLSFGNAIDLPQFVNLSAVAPNGIEARLGSTQLSLAGGAERAVDLVVSAAAADGTVRVVATTDLGGRVVLDVPVKAAPTLAAGNTSASPGPTSTAAVAKDSKDSPSPPAGPAAVGVLAAVGLLRRRR